MARPSFRLKCLFGERAARTLRVSAVFNTRRQYTQLASAGLTADIQTKYETRVGYLGFTRFLGTNKPASTIENQPKGDTGGSAASAEITAKPT